MHYSNRMFQITYVKKGLSPNLLVFLEHKGFKTVNLFGISKLIELEPINIFILPKKKFEKEQKLYFREYISPDCIAFSNWRVVAESYNDLKIHCTDSEYCKLILHECIHILQRFTTKIPPYKAIWLYESVACYLAGQKKKCILEKPDWETMKHNFYSVKNCYAIAYRLGEVFFTQFGIQNALQMCREPKLCETYFRKYINDL